jgi:hypothetical protein
MTTDADGSDDESDPDAETPEKPDAETQEMMDADTPEETDAQSRTDHTAGGDTVLGIDSERLATFFRWGVLFVLGVVILVAGGGLYSSLGAIIDVWIADRYQPFARAGLNFALLCGAIAGVIATLRRV